jgi:hypothetical protein
VNAAEAVRLLAHCSAFDNRQPSEAAATAWAAALHNMPADQDAFAAIARFYGTPPPRPGERLWIQPHDVRTIRQQIRDERLTGFRYEPAAGDDNPERYLTNLRQQREAVASGRRAATGTPELAGGPHPAVAARIAELGTIGRHVPGGDEPDRPARRGPLTVPCPQCQAPLGRPCRTPGTAKKRGGERGPHSARRAAAAGEPVDTEATRREAERRREASRLRLQQQHTDEPA